METVGDTPDETAPETAPRTAPANPPIGDETDVNVGPQGEQNPGPTTNEGPMLGNPEPGRNIGDGGNVVSPQPQVDEEPAPRRSMRDLWNTLVTRVGHHDLAIGEDEELS